jgi:hypothetical protein
MYDKPAVAAGLKRPVPFEFNISAGGYAPPKDALDETD